MNSKILLSPPVFSGDEMTYIQQAINAHSVASHGENIDVFETQLASYLSVPEVVALNSGTSAIHLALLALGVKRGDEVLCQSFTFSATANPIVYVGAQPIFIDSETETWNMCPELLEEAIKNRLKQGKKPKAIIAVHLYGMPYKVEAIHALSQKYEIPVIEDAAEALGSHVNGRFCGSFGDFAIFSFNGNKIITTGAGGALVCKTNVQKAAFIHLATQAKDNAPHYQHSMIGYNYRMCNILAGIGRAQLAQLDTHIVQKRKIYADYKAELDGTFSFLDGPATYYSNRWLTCIQGEDYAQREQIRKRFDENQIEVKPLWKPLHLQPVFEHYPKFINGTSEKIFNKGLCLPSGVRLSKTAIDKVISVLQEQT